MNWAVFIPIIAEHGFDFALRLWQLREGKTDPTQEEWDQLRKLSKKTASDYLAAAMERADG